MCEYVAADLLKSSTPVSLRGKVTYEQFMRESKQRDRARQEEEAAAEEEEAEEEEDDGYGEDFFASFFGFHPYVLVL